MNNTEQKELEQKAFEIRQKIASLADFEGDSLKGEMQALKASLLESPAACSLLLPEDIGQMVAYIRKITGVAIAEANAPKERKPREKKLSPLDLKAQLALIPDDEF